MLMLIKTCSEGAEFREEKSSRKKDSLFVIIAQHVLPAATQLQSLRELTGEIDHIPVRVGNLHILASKMNGSHWKITQNTTEININANQQCN